MQRIVRIGAANGISKFIIGQDGILSTPAASALIQKRSADGGIILTALHNPGGPENDFGIKYNTCNVTNAIYQATCTISEYKEANLDKPVDLSTTGIQRFGPVSVEIVDSITNNVDFIKIFDFELIRQFRQQTPELTLLFDALHGVTGPYGRRIFVDELGFPETVEKHRISLGAASDGDGDCNMVLSHDWFATPSDSVAVIAHYADCIPYFKRTGIRGLARSMPTSCAIDRVAAAKGIESFEVPTGWELLE
ncbi:hypothetical protein BX667DRAFT_510934 [Coemansia mojavensis]|nr:hypothetical protein BX667DRAFT_510934 [Coemansia mojavensis]